MATVLFLLLFPMTSWSQFLEDKTGGKIMNTKEISFAQLYGGKEWKTTIEYWVASHLYTSESAVGFAEKFVLEAETALCNSFKENPKVALLLANDLISFMEQLGIDTVTEKIAVYASQLGLKDEKIDKIVTTTRLQGRLAPLIRDVKELKNTILIFHESGCGSCDNEISQLIDNYPVLQSKGYEVISIAADNDPTIYQATAEALPWQAKYCDGEGMGGKDFQNYGVIGTPTMYVIDKKGIIQGRAARLIDLVIY